MSSSNRQIVGFIILCKAYSGMPGFSNSLSMPSESDSYRQQLYRSVTICLMIRSISINVSDLQICNFATTYDGQTAEKVCPTYPPIYTATALPHPSNSQWTQICDFRTRTRNPGLTFPKPENPGLQKEPGFDNSTADWSTQHARVIFGMQFERR